LLKTRRGINKSGERRKRAESHLDPHKENGFFKRSLVEKLERVGEKVWERELMESKLGGTPSGKSAGK